MERADKLSLDGAVGRLRAIECAIQALILTHPDPQAFSETMEALARAVSNRAERDERSLAGKSSEGFRDGCDEFCRAADVARRTGANGNGNGLSDSDELQA